MSEKITYKEIVKYSITTLIMIFLSRAVNTEIPLAIAVSSAMLYLGFSPIGITVSLEISALAFMNFNLSVQFLYVSAVVFLYYFAKKKLKFKFKAEIILITLLSLALFVAKNLNPFGLVSVALITLLAILSVSALRVAFINGFTYKLTQEELICLGVFAFAVALGVVDVLGVNISRGVFLLIMLYCTYLLGASKTALISVILSLATSIHEQSLNYTAIFSVWVLMLSVNAFFKPFAGILVILCDFCLYYAFKIYDGYTYVNFLPLIVAVIIYTFTPEKSLNKLGNKIYAFKDKKLIKNTINNVRRVLSGKIYDVANVFGEIEQSVCSLNELTENNEDYKLKMAESIKNSVCSGCILQPKCRKHDFPSNKILYKLLSVGIAKNRISFVDLPKEFTDVCGYPNSMIYEINGKITCFKERAGKLCTDSSGKEIIKLQSQGVEKALKSLAFDLSKTLAFSDDLRDKIFRALSENGFAVTDLMIFGEGKDCEISFISKRSILDSANFIKIISNVVKTDLTVISKTDLTENTVAITLKPSPVYDAFFGVATKTKKSSNKSGDTHSLTKLDEGKFMVALNDGMGSGELANGTSATAMNLIETFYKAKIDFDVIIQTVNKLLSMAVEDVFTALDIAVVDLYGGNLDFIKIGAPFGLLLEKDGVKIIEGSSVPLGIVDDIDVSSCKIPLPDDSTLILMSDGITDAFGSATELTEFLRGVYDLNPQNLADKILSKALKLYKGDAKDDLTVLSVRIYKK